MFIIGSKLKENGCIMDEKVSAQAALNGNVQVMMWLKENKCPLYKNTSLNALIQSKKMMQWLSENACSQN